MIVFLPGQSSDQTAWVFQSKPFKEYKLAFFHFSNNNLSIRKSCALELGKYDLNALKSEDVDICFRLGLNPHWVAVREQGSFVRHKPRKTFMALLKQMWGWGHHVGYPYSKTGIHGVYFYWLHWKTHRIAFDFQLERFPILICAFITDFHLMHLFSFAFILLALSGSGLAAALTGLFTILFCARYLYDDWITDLRPLKKLQVAGTHYLANLIFSIAAFTGGLKHGIILIPSSIFPPPDDKGNRA
jgi:hypothetical protein